MSSNAITWPPWEVTSLNRNLRALMEVVEDSERKLEPEVKAWLARLLVVRATGYLEQSIAECCRAHVSGKSGGWVRSFAHSWLERTKNPTPANLGELLGRFDNNLQAQFEELLRENDETRLRELSFLVGTRNNIAHGKNEGIGPIKALELARTARELVDWFVLKLNPSR